MDHHPESPTSLTSPHSISDPPSVRRDPEPTFSCDPRMLGRRPKLSRTDHARLFAAGASHARARNVGPVQAGRHLHQDEERDHGADRDREPRVALEEEGVREEHEEDELGGPRLQERRAHAGHDPEVAHDQQDADRGGDHERDVDVDVVDEVGEQQVEGEEGRRQEEVVHGMEAAALHHAHDHHHRQEEEQPHGREEGDAGRERARVQPVGRLHPDPLAGGQAVEAPGEPPARGRLAPCASARWSRPGSRRPRSRCRA